MKEIIKKSGKLAVKITDKRIGVEIFTISNGNQWTGHGLTPVLATLMIQALQEYLDGLSVSQPVDYVKPIAYKG